MKIKEILKTITILFAVQIIVLTYTANEHPHPAVASQSEVPTEIQGVTVIDTPEQPVQPAPTPEPVVTEPTPAVSTEPTEGMQYVGEFRVSAYCACPQCCEKPVTTDDYGITASGATTKEGVTIAVDPDVIPLGTEVYINGVGYRTAQDVGGAIEGNEIDLYFTNHEDAQNFEVKYLDVYTKSNV